MREFRGVVLMILLCAGAATAFIPGPTVIRECPQCRVPIEQDTMTSGNTFGARFWSDGKMASYPANPSSLATICSNGRAVKSSGAIGIAADAAMTVTVLRSTGMMLRF